MKVPAGFEINLSIVKNIINLFKKANRGVSPSFVIVSLDVWYNLCHEKIMNGSADGCNPYDGELVVLGVSVISSREFSMDRIEAVEAFDTTFELWS